MSIHLLTTLDVERTTCDGGGLYLTVDPNGGRYWAFRYVLNGKRMVMGLGNALKKSLAQAREEAAKYRAIKALGRCPLTERRERQAAAKAAAAAESPIHLLTTLDVERTTCDGGGLYLTVDPKWRTRCWAFKYRFNGKPRTMGLGSARDVTLAQAREEAAKYRAIKALGRCPLAERRERQAPAKAAAAALTASRRSTTAPGVYRDGRGLYLLVRPNGGRHWLYEYTFDGKKRTMGLGSAHVVTLAQAREEAAKYRAIKALGRCPLTERRERQAAAKAANATARLTLAQARVKKFAEMLALAQARAEKLAQTRTQP
jgi:ferredoxin